MTTYIWPEGGGGGPTGPDHIAPKYLIGNVPAGDSAVAYSQDGFIYLPDAGDGAAIQQALLAIAGNPSTDPPTPAVPGDVWIRPGTYDLTAGAVLLPLTVPAGTRVQGAGESTALTATLTTGVGTLFALEARTDLRDLVIEATDEGDSTGTALVLAVDGTAHCERLHVTLTREITSTSTVLAAFGNAESARLEQDRCLVELTGTTGPLVPPTPTAALAGYRLTGGVLRLDVCRVEGGDAHVVLTNATGHIDQCELDGFGFWGVYAEDTDLTVTGGTTLISDSVNATAVQMVEVNGDPDLLFHARIDLPLDESTTGILANTKTGQITGSKIQASTGIDTSAGPGPGFTVVANVVEADAGQQILPSAFDEVAHNITY